jgi:hypothetical protein
MFQFKVEDRAGQRLLPASFTSGRLMLFWRFL